MEDSRISNARLVAELYAQEERVPEAINDLIAYGEERLRINVGLISENEALRKRLRELEHGS